MGVVTKNGDGQEGVELKGSLGRSKPGFTTRFGRVFGGDAIEEEQTLASDLLQDRGSDWGLETGARKEREDCLPDSQASMASGFPGRDISLIC